MFRAYMKLLETHPYTTKGLTSATICAFGDGIQQRLEYQHQLKQHSPSTSTSTSTSTSSSDSGSSSSSTPTPVPSFLSTYNWGRTARMATFGGFFIGPVMHNWFKILDRVVTTTGNKAAAAKMLIDQSIMAPAFTVSFFTLMSAMEGASFTQIKEKVANETIPTLLANYQVWPATQLVCFYVVPLQFRVLWVNMVGLGWNAYLSRRMHAHAPVAVAAKSAPIPIPALESK